MAVIRAIVYILSAIILMVADTLSIAQAESGQDAPIIPVFSDPKGIRDRPEGFPEKIQFLATDAYPPFVFRDATGRLTGFNVDLSRAICLELASSCSLRIKEFDALVPALEEGEGDAIISGLAPSTALSDTVRFSPDYLKLPARFIIRRDDVSTFDENALAGVKVAVAAGSRHEAFALRFFPSALLQSYPTVTAARTAVSDGVADAHFGDSLSLAFWQNSESSKNCCAFSGGPWLEPGYFDTGLSIAVRKQDVERAQAIEYALQLLVQKGTFRELYLRYFPLGFY